MPTRNTKIKKRTTSKPKEKLNQTSLTKLWSNANSDNTTPNQTTTDHSHGKIHASTKDSVSDDGSIIDNASITSEYNERSTIVRNPGNTSTTKTYKK
jgi:hypothetical protein